MSMGLELLYYVFEDWNLTWKEELGTMVALLYIFVVIGIFWSLSLYFDRGLTVRNERTTIMLWLKGMQWAPWRNPTAPTPETKKAL